MGPPVTDHLLHASKNANPNTRSLSRCCTSVLCKPEPNIRGQIVTHDQQVLLVAQPLAHVQQIHADNLVWAIAVNSMTERSRHDFFSSCDSTVVAPATQLFDVLVEAAPPEVLANDTSSRVHASLTYRSAMRAEHDLEFQFQVLLRDPDLRLSLPDLIGCIDFQSICTRLSLLRQSYRIHVRPRDGSADCMS